MICRRCRKFNVWRSLTGRLCRRCENAIQQHGIAVRCCVDEICDLQAAGATSKAAAEIITKYRHAELLEDPHARRVIWTTAVEHVCRDGLLTSEEEASLVLLKDALGISDVELLQLDAGVRRLRETSTIQAGRLPSVTVSGISLQKNEKGHFHFPGVEFHQERVVSREYVGGSSGVSFRICRGVSYRIGSHRGRMISREQIVQLDAGELLLTSKRLIYSGQKTAFSIAYPKILSAMPFADGMGVIKDSAARNNKPFYFICDDGELLNVALSACLNKA